MQCFLLTIFVTSIEQGKFKHWPSHQNVTITTSSHHSSGKYVFFLLTLFSTFDFLATLIRNVVQSAMDDFKQFTCIQFTERTTEADYLSFQAENTG